MISQARWTASPSARAAPPNFIQTVGVMASGRAYPPSTCQATNEDVSFGFSATLPAREPGPGWC